MSIGCEPFKAHINVTADHIARGEAGECSRCPIALATLEVIPGVTLISVDDLSIDIMLHDGRKMSAPMPNEGSEFVYAFDAEWDEVQPFEFDAKFEPSTPVRASQWPKASTPSEAPHA